MYFLILMAFALVLSENMPPAQLNLFGGLPLTGGACLFGTLALVIVQFPVVWAVGLVARRRVFAHLDGTANGHDAAADTHSTAQVVLLFLLAGFLALNMLFTPWPALVRVGWGLGHVPLVGDLLLLVPFFTALLIKWVVFYSVEVRLHESAPQGAHEADDGSGALSPEPTVDHHSPVETSLRSYLGDKFRHQVLLLAVPMSIIVFAKRIIYDYGPSLVDYLKLPPDAGIRAMILNTALGTVSVSVLILAPLMLRYLWSTEPLPAGPLRDRFVATCRRIGLRYREILLWRTHGMAVNAAVMGVVAPLRYILVSDALLDSMDEEEIEAVFGHEAGHVRHWHLPYFGLFAIVSMYVAGGVMHILFFADRDIDRGILQLSSLLALLAMWLFGFSWISRRFERQADLYGVRCITPDMKNCPPSCPVHGDTDRTGLCIGAANLFGRTLAKIADLNGIPRDASSWRHGSIEDRCKQIEAFSHDTPALKRFDQRLLQIKLGLIALTVIGSVIAVWLYYPYVATVFGWR
jgi:STE24 endopeptidase